MRGLEGSNKQLWIAGDRHMPVVSATWEVEAGLLELRLLNIARTLSENKVAFPTGGQRSQAQVFFSFL